MSSPLTQEQLEAFDRDGFIVASGLIPAAVSTQAVATLWSCLDLSPDEPAGWPAGTQFQHQDHPDLLACYTPELMQAVVQLVRDDPTTLPAPKAVTSIVGFPPAEPVDWKWPKPHIDHALKEHGFKTFPEPFRLASMLFLNDVGLHGGGTVVWPGSHKQIDALAKSDPARYETMWALNQGLGHLDLADPIELQPRQGDILFYRCYCAHAGNANITPQPRLAFNAKW